MAKNTQLDIDKFTLDLKNYRTTPQKNESDAIKAMISIKPDKFFGLMQSILDDGYLQTENIIVLQDSSKNHIVKEGNRRIGCLKLIHQKFNIDEFSLPESIENAIKSISPQWLIENSKISCIIFEETESLKAEKIVSLTHAKGEKAGRDKWTSVATARHNRDFNKKPEPVLDLLEKYLIQGKNLSLQQKERWAGDYNLTVLVEAVSKIYSRFGVANPSELALQYPKIKFLTEFEDLIRDIGLETVGFPKIRNANEDFATLYGILALPVASTAPVNPAVQQSASASPQGLTTPSLISSTPSVVQPQAIATPAMGTTPQPTPTSKSPKSVASNDPKYVKKLLKSFNPRGNNRAKVVTLKNELLKLKIEDNPIAFCFLLRSMFEISAKAYFIDHSLSMTKSNGKDKSLVEVLTEAKNHLTVNNSNVAMVKILHGAMTNISTPDKLLSVTTMNHLVHNPNFSVIPNDICILFGNIYPLLEAMN